MLPLSDGIPARRFPVVNVAIIVATWRSHSCASCQTGLLVARALVGSGRLDAGQDDRTALGVPL
jgi:hypothetical protein